MFLLSFVSPSQPFWVSFLLLTLSLPLMPADTACCFPRPPPQSSAPCACTPMFFQHTLEGACRQWGTMALPLGDHEGCLACPWSTAVSRGYSSLLPLHQVRVPAES